MEPVLWVEVVLEPEEVWAEGAAAVDEWAAQNQGPDLPDNVFVLVVEPQLPIR